MKIIMVSEITLAMATAGVAIANDGGGDDPRPRKC